MLRLVAAKDGALLPDLNGRLPGRGAHLCPDLRCFAQAERNQGLTRTLHTTVHLNDPVRIVLSYAAGYRQQALELLARSARIGVPHRGIARRLKEQLYKMSRLLDSVHANNNQSQRHLTAREVFEMMPPEISGQWSGR
jgi:Predicted nucleic-acid-binding protein implicated in transcription termination